jgi:hypothetical protein
MAKKAFLRCLLPSPAVHFLLSRPGRHVAFALEKLLVYQKFVDFADAVCAQTEQFTRG